MFIINKSIEIAKEKLPSIYQSRKVHHFGFAWQRSNLLCYGVNEYRENPKVYHLGRSLGNVRQARFKTAHAEIATLLKLLKLDCPRASIVILRLSADGSLRNSKPCRECHRTLSLFNYKKIHYSTESGFIEI